MSENKGNLIQCIKQVLSKRVGFHLTDEQVNEFLDAHPQINSSDTFDIEYYTHYLAMKIVGLDWPMNSSSQEYTEYFFNTLVEKSSDYGYLYIKK